MNAAALVPLQMEGRLRQTDGLERAPRQPLPTVTPDVAGAAAPLAESGEPDAEAAADCVALPRPGVGPGVGPGVPDGVLGWAGVQAVRAARPVPASRRRLNARRLGESCPASCRPDVSPPPL